MNDDQSKRPDPQSGNTSDSTSTGHRDQETLPSRSNASEIAGETVAVVGESTGRFPRATSVEQAERENTGRSPLMVGAGILISRIIGVVRQRVFAHYLGISDAAGAFNAAFKIPNFLQNIFGDRKSTRLNSSHTDIS